MDLKNEAKFVEKKDSSIILKFFCFGSFFDFDFDFVLDLFVK